MVEDEGLGGLAGDEKHCEIVTWSSAEELRSSRSVRAGRRIPDNGRRRGRGELPWLQEFFRRRCSDKVGAAGFGREVGGRSNGGIG